MNKNLKDIIRRQKCLLLIQQSTKVKFLYLNVSFVLEKMRIEIEGGGQVEFGEVEKES